MTLKFKSVKIYLLSSLQILEVFPLRKVIFLNILIIYTSANILYISTPLALAMSKRPRSAKQTESVEYVLPEIEIISQPEANRKLLLGDQTNKKRSPTGVSPTEVLPAVGKDAKIAAKGYRTCDIQQALHNAGYNIGSIDGKMGPKTKKAIQDFQNENDLTVDGIVGKKTWAALKIYLEQTQSSNENQ